MKTLIAVPETKAEWKAVWDKNKKKVIGAAVAAGGFIAGAVLTHGKLWGNDGQLPEGEPDTAGYLTDGGEDNEEVSNDCPFENESEEESEESEGDAE